MNYNKFYSNINTFSESIIEALEACFIADDRDDLASSDGFNYRLWKVSIFLFSTWQSNINIHSATTKNTNFGDKIMKLRKAKLDMIQLSWDWSKLINYLVFHSIFFTCILFVVFVCLNTIVWKLSSSLVKCYWNLETNLYPNNCTQLWRSQVKNICNYCLCTKLF